MNFVKTMNSECIARNLSFRDNLYINRCAFLIRIQRSHYYEKRIKSDKDISKILQMTEKNQLNLPNLFVPRACKLILHIRAGPGQDPVRPWGPGPAWAGPGPFYWGPVHQSLARSPGPLGPGRAGPLALPVDSLVVVFGAVLDIPMVKCEGDASNRPR